jgi:hypothetical protein
MAWQNTLSATWPGMGRRALNCWYTSRLWGAEPGDVVAAELDVHAVADAGRMRQEHLHHAPAPGVQRAWFGRLAGVRVFFLDPVQVEPEAVGQEEVAPFVSATIGSNATSL